MYRDFTSVSDILYLSYGLNILGLCNMIIIVNKIEAKSRTFDSQIR